jgi:uncharacterized coiled-coil protein SlyX
MPKQNIKTENRITTLEEWRKACECDIKEIKETITNHIPTSIKELDTKIDGIKEELNKRPSWFITALVSLLLMLVGTLLGIIFK